MGEHAFLDGLDAAQRAAVTSDAAPLCILAGAGSGKTRVLTRRIAHRCATGSADAAHVLALTFTRKAAGELRTRLAALGVRERVAAGTFHGVALAQLRRWWLDAGLTPPAVLDRKTALLTGFRAGDVVVTPAEVAAEIEWAKARLVTPDRYAAAVAATGRAVPGSAAAVADAFARYEDTKRRRGLVDFDDLLVRCAEALESDAAFAAAQRWRFRHLFVDEFQDVNPAQFRLLEAWRGGRDDLCVVGDPNQAIYSWNGADPRYLERFTGWFPTGSVVRLETNYRSTAAVLRVAEASLGRRRLQHAARGDGPTPTVRAHDTDVDEATAVARAVRDGHRPGAPWSHVAILARTNAQSALLEGALRAAGVPSRVRGGGLLRRPAVREAVGILAARGPAVGLGSRLADIDAMAQETADGDRRDDLEALVRLGREFSAIEPDGEPGAFVAWLRAVVGDDADDDGRRRDAVEITTFHRAKGLEWPVVHVVGLERGFVPIGHARGEEALDEERRLLYVALTRAEDELHCSWARSRTFGTRTVGRSPSPWLAAVEAAIRSLEVGGADGDWRAHLDAGRRTLAAVDARRPRRPAAILAERADPLVLDALRAWRAAAARAAGVPASMILHDATLAAVAEARPADRDALLALPGLGTTKAERYGDALLAVVARSGASA